MKFTFAAAIMAVVSQADVIETSEAYMKNVFTHFADKDTVQTLSHEIGQPAMHESPSDGK